MHTTSNNATTIRTTSLTRDFPRVRAVDGLALEVPAGIVFGFLGPNGSGKTTTIRLLLGLLEPTSGGAEVLGLDVRTKADVIRARAGALLEHTGLYERLSAVDNLEYYGRIARMPAADRTARIQDLLSQFGLWDRRTETVGAWSRGMKQKLAVARALLHRPPLIFLDEPTASLDPVASAALRDDLARLAAREGVTVFLTTHNLAEAERLCARVAVIREGRLLAVGPPAELNARQNLRVRIAGRGFSNEVVARLRALPDVTAVAVEGSRLAVDLREGTDMAPVVSFLVQQGAAIEEVHREQASLEDVFLTLMEEEQ